MAMLNNEMVDEISKTYGFSYVWWFGIPKSYGFS